MAQRLLIIEDDKLLGEVLTRKLTGEGFEVTLCNDGAEGLAKLKEMRPDMVLLDIILPTMNGYEILEARAQDESLKAIPIIIISNSGQPVEINRALALGVKDYLIKAVIDPETVLEKVRYHLAHPDAQAPAQVSIKGKKILWVEDDTFLSEILGKRFEREQCISLYCPTGEDALQELATETPDLIMLDLILPGMSGFEILEKIKKDERLRPIPVIVFSNLGQQSDIDAVMRLGALKHFVKAEMNPDDIVREIADTLASQS